MSTWYPRWTLCLVLLGAALSACPEPSDLPNPPSSDAARHDAGVDASAPDSAGADGAVADASADGGSQPDAAGSDSSGSDLWEPSCEDECSPGSQVCDSSVDGYRLCGQYDLDDCLELSPTVTCAAGFTCGQGVCVPDCRDECPASGTLCQDASTVLSCGNFDSDACLDLGAAVSCGSGKKCEAGQCVDLATPCSDECTSGQNLCFGDAVRVCGSYDGDTCLDLGMPVTCAAGHVCADGTCVPYCVDECAAAGLTECVGNGTRSCGNFDGDSCLEWSAVTACVAPQFCTAGVCSVTCSHECDSVGQLVCVSGGVASCGEYDGDPCRDLSTPTPCPAGYACGSGGLCTATCTNDCALTGSSPRCGADDHSIETCGDFDADVCSEWGGVIACPGGASCSNGSCDIPCSNDCSSAGESECVNGSNGFRTCGQFDLDSCLEWAPTTCESWEECSDGACVLGATPATILINEVLYDAAGTDTAAGTMVFVELWGPASQDLDGYELVGVNGNGGTEYNRIALTGEVMGSDGFFVIAHPSAASALLDAADITKSEVDYQNGPDSIQLRWRGRVVDALGYGAFGASDVFAGEGTAAPGSGSGKSLSRNASHADTDVNSADFSIALAPSPHGNPPLCLDECPTLNATQCSGSQVQTCRADVDADSCLEWTAPAACPTAGQSCVGTACQAAACSDECSPLNATECVGQQIRTCRTDVDQDSCREWTAPVNCSVGGQVCNSQSNTCETPSCSNDCSPGTDLPQCGGTNGQQIRSCVVDGDADPCYEWSAFSDCTTGGQICIGGTCATPCEQECPASGATRCALNGQIETCGNYDGDACREWSAPASCGGGMTCIADTCQPPSAPEVRLISPQGTVQTTQGNTHRILVDATAAPGRTIVRVDYYVNNVKQGETTASPHEFFYTVPAATPTNSTLSVQARAVDNQNVTGSSTFSYLDVKNDPPVAAFTAIITNINAGTGTVTVDASAVTDTETASEDLEVCWDWNNSGTCTSFSTTKVTTHQYPAPAPGPTTYTIRMVVRDAVDQTAATTRDVTFTSIQYVGGQTIGTTLWYGTVVITGDVTVGSSATLTIAEGTQVLFVRTDQNSDGIGDYTFDVAGALVVNGTAGNPVVFTGQDAGAKVPGAWDRILLQGGSASSLTHAIIEYADVGIEMRNGSTLDHVTVRSTRGDCVALNNADSAVLTDVSVTLCGGNGVSVYNGTAGASASNLSSTQNGASALSLWQTSGITVVGATLADNTAHGARVGTGSTLNLSDGLVQDNGGTGLSYISTAGGAAAHNQIRRNGNAGVLLLSDGSGHPNPVLQYSNIYSNAATGSTSARQVSPASITTSYTCCDTAGSTSPTYTAPQGATIRRARVVYSESTADGSHDNGWLLTGGGSTITSWSSGFTGWVYLPDGTTTLKVKTSDDYRSDTETITLTDVELIEDVGAHDVVAITDSGTVDLRFNYLGTFPSVLNRVQLTRSAALNLQGYVGAPFDATWSRGPYVGGADATGAWSGTVYVTGNVTVPAGADLDVAAGSQILFVTHDQDGDGAGDWSIIATGSLDLNGATGNEVLVKAYASSGDDFQTVSLNGSGGDASTWSDVQVADGKVGVTLRGAASLTRVAVAGGSSHGVAMLAGSGATLSLVQVTDAGGDGVHVAGATGATLASAIVTGCAGSGMTFASAGSTTLSRPLVRDNGEHGIVVQQGSNLSIADSTVRNNAGHGILTRSGTASVTYSLITDNAGAGLWVQGNANLTASHNVIKYNGDAGASIWSDSTGSPTAGVQTSNIYGNSATGSSETQTVNPAGITASYTCCDIAGSTSPTYTAPVGTTIRRARVVYSESTADGSHDNGWLLTGGGATITSWSSGFTGWVYLPDGTTTLRVKTSDDYRSDTETITVSDVELVDVATGSSYQLVNVTDSGTTLAKFNYWTWDMPTVPGEIFESRAGSVDFSGSTGLEYPGVCPDATPCETAGVRP